MRKFLALTLVTLTLAVAQGQSLKENMKETGTIFKAIGASIKDPGKNAENAQASQKMSDLFKLTKEQVPDAFEDIPEAQRAQALVEYQDMIQKTVDLVDQLTAAFLNNDNAKAEEIYRLLKDAKAEGHDRFDP